MSTTDLGAVADAVGSVLGVRPTALVPTAGGHHGSWYGALGDVPVVVKVAPSVAFEAWALSAVRARGVPAPEVLAEGTGAGTALGQPFLVTRRIDGTALARRARVSRRVVQQAGRVLRGIHEVTAAGFGLPDEDALRAGTVRGASPTWSAAVTTWVGSLLTELDGRIDGATADAVRTAVDAHRPVLDRCERASLVHGDFAPRNLLVARWGRRVSGVVDFGGAQLGAPAYDLAVFSLARPQLPELAEGYERDPWARQALLDEVPLYRMVRGVAEAAWAAMAGVDLTRPLHLLRLHLRACGG